MAVDDIKKDSPGDEPNLKEFSKIEEEIDRTGGVDTQKEANLPPGVLEKMGEILARENSGEEDTDTVAETREADQETLGATRQEMGEADKEAAKSTARKDWRALHGAMNNKYGRGNLNRPIGARSSAWHVAEGDKQMVLNSGGEEQEVKVGDVFNFSVRDPHTKQYKDNWRKWEGAGKGWTENIADDELATAKSRDYQIRQAQRSRAPRPVEPMSSPGLNILESDELDALLIKYADVPREEIPPEDQKTFDRLVAKRDAAIKARPADGDAKPGDGETKSRPAEGAKGGKWDDKIEAAKHDELRELRRSLGVKRGEPWDSFNAGGEHDIGRVHSQEDFDKVKAAIENAPKGGADEGDEKPKLKPKPDDAKAGVLGSEPPPGRGPRYTMEQLPDGGRKFTRIDPDGKETTWIEGAVKTATDQWSELGPEYQAAAARTDAVQAALVPQPRNWYTRVKDWFKRGPQVTPSTEITDDQRLDKLLNDKNLPAPERARLALAAELKEKIVRRDLEIKKRGVEKFFSKEHLKGTPWAVARTMGLMTGIAAVGAVTGLWVPFALSAVLGSGVGAFVQKYMQNRLEGVGDKSAKITSIIIGAVAGIASGAALYSSGIDQAVANTGFGKWIASFFGGGTGVEAAIGGTGGAGVPFESLSPEKIFCEDVFFDPSPITGNDSVWAQLTDNLKDMDKLGYVDISNQGREAFAHAFQNTIDKGGYHDQLLQYKGRFLSDISSWKTLPDGTVPRFDKIFSNPDFVQDLCRNISEKYPSLAREITSSNGMGIKTFIDQIAYTHGAR